MIDIPADMDKLKLTWTYHFGMAGPPVPKLSHPRILEVSDAFTTNIQRLRSMMVYPAFLAEFAGTVQRTTVRAEYELTGQVEIEESLREPKEAHEIFERFKVLFHERNLRMQALMGDQQKLADQAEDAVQKGAAVTVLYAAAPMGNTATEFALMSYLTSAWTAFETAAGDLWEAALNQRPQGLADLNGKKRYRKTDRANDSGPKFEKSVKLDLIRSQEWDTRNRMGTILRDKFAFTTLAGIREAYETAFYKKADDIDSAVLNDGFDELSVLRNVIVHKSGRADAEYISKAKSIASLPQLQKGESLELDGKVVSDLIHKVTIATYDLTYRVDEWLTQNAIKPAEDPA
jgi:hypothetical protein